MKRYKRYQMIVKAEKHAASFSGTEKSERFLAIFSINNVSFSAWFVYKEINGKYPAA